MAVAICARSTHVHPVPSDIQSNGAIDEEIDSGGTTNDRAGGHSTLRALHPAGPIPSGGPVAGHDDGLRPQEHRQLPRLKRRRQRRHRQRRRTLQHLGGAQRAQVQGGVDIRGQRVADVFVVAVRVVGPLRRAAAITMPSPPEVPRRRR